MKNQLRLGLATIGVSFASLLLSSCADFTFGASKGDDPLAEPKYGGQAPPAKRQTPPPEPTAAQEHSTEVKAGNVTWQLRYERKNDDGSLVNVLGRAQREDEEAMYFLTRRCEVKPDQMTLTGWPQVSWGRSLTVATEPATGFVVNLTNNHVRQFGGRSQTRIVQ